AEGFKKEVRTGVVVSAGQNIQADVVLAAGAVTETVEVSTVSDTLIDATSANLATTLASQQVKDIPDVGRNAYYLTSLMAGVVPNGNANRFQTKQSGFNNPFSAAFTSVSSMGIPNAGGSHDRQLLNGVPNDPPEGLGGGVEFIGFVPSPEAIQEFKRLNGTWDAAVGHGSGISNSVVVRTGTNGFHGAAFYAFQNTYLNANLADRVFSGQNRPNYQRNEVGLVVDGPVVIPKLYNGRDKTFFMFAFERYATHSIQTYSTRLPSPAELGGDFSELCNSFDANGLCTSGVQLYDPLSPVVNNLRTAYFPHNNIAGRINTTGAALASYYPTGWNIPGANASSNINFNATNVSYPNTVPSFIGRFDQQINSKNRLTVLGFRNGLTQTFPMVNFPIQPPNAYGYHVFRNNRGGSIDDVHQFSDTMVLDSRFGLIYHPIIITYPGQSGYDLSTLHMNVSPLPYNSFPGMGMDTDNYPNLASGANGHNTIYTVGQLAETLTKVWGRHSVRFGFEGQVTRYNGNSMFSGWGPTYGFHFDRGFTQQDISIAPANSTSGDALASMLLGYFSQVSYNLGINYATQQKYIAGFVQDDWRFNNKLTVNLGLRWDYEGPITERYNRMITGFCFTCASPLQPQVPGLTLNGGLQYAGVDGNSRGMFPATYHNWQPRLGLAYQYKPGTVFHAGYGIVYFNTMEAPYSTGYSQVTSFSQAPNSVAMGQAVYTADSPLPNGILLPAGNSLGLSAGLGQGVSFMAQNHVQPRIASWTLSLQQQLPGNWALQVAYVGSHPTRMDVVRNLNYLPKQYFDQGQAGVDYLNTAVPNPLAGQIPGNATLNAPTIAQWMLLVPYPQFASTAQGSNTNFPNTGASFATGQAGVLENGLSIGSSLYDSLQISASHPMSHHFSVGGNFTWQKTMTRITYLNLFDTKLASIQDPLATLVGNLYGTYEFPRFGSRPYWERQIIGGWKMNANFQDINGTKIPAPANVDIIGNVRQPNASMTRFFNTCYEDVNGNQVPTSGTSYGCDTQSPTPAFRQRLAYTTQYNDPYLPVRSRIRPTFDLSMFKQFPLFREGQTFEIRGEFFNVLNTPNFGMPGTAFGTGGNFGRMTNSQVNDPRMGMLTARINW
ncbi:MAG: carboxypeptidase regulatory-like domain-containing protein, partial [Acidobacteriaceae bacterium]|nr:carboxypeptidase regulatory-like domain-containing protein [Acidobacteriaceae bacterium]